MRAFAYLLYYFLFIAVGFVFSSCAYPRGGKDVFPAITASVPVSVYKSSSSGEKIVCEITDTNSAKELLLLLSQKYPNNWRRPSPVAFAPTYRLVSNSAEISFLEKGILISFEKNGDNVSLVNDATLQDLENILNSVCAGLGR